ncbi:hypothetical protein NHX12_004271 [Muraenolepis orangiensis]|uniref:TLC domain-containing protein n=1 Tax=Muraenolepis orangiensis TaxID=630683 RepID=A0A9Q0DUW9_9TELE|nr:hypothetical protein NHX12_004271 [Muraenolepis orangiensis]
MDLLPDPWRAEFWLPPGVSWLDMEQLADEDRPRPRDLLLALPLALGFVVLRYVFERFLAPPIGRCLGLKNRPQVAAVPSPKLESFYSKQSRQPSQREMVCLMTDCGKSQRQIQTWFRLRRNQDRPSNAKKFAEAGWRFCFYFTAFLAGLTCVIDRPWFWDQRECWRSYPFQPMERAHYWYYMLELGFYCSLLLRISVDVKRKDFREQVIHHFATIFLLGFSYCANYVRIGTLVMLLHDSSDILLESAKMFNYGSGWRRTCDWLFVAFAAVFLLTRLVLFPGRIIYATLVLSMERFQPFAGYYFFNVMLMVLQVLHIFWAYLILRMAYKFLFFGKLDKDERSDEESEEEEEKGGEDSKEAGAEYCWGKSSNTLNSKFSRLTKNCVLTNLNNHRAIAVDRSRKAQ